MLKRNLNAATVQSGNCEIIQTISVVLNTISLKILPHFKRKNGFGFLQRTNEQCDKKLMIFQPAVITGYSFSLYKVIDTISMDPFLHTVKNITVLKLLWYRVLHCSNIVEH